MSDRSIRDHRRARPTGRTMSARVRWAGLFIGACAIFLVGFAAGTGAARALVPAGPATPFDGPLASCRLDDRLTSHRAPADWARTLLDQEFALGADYVPTDLVALADRGIDGQGSLRSLVIDDLVAMATDARDGGSAFRITSAFRSYQHQVRTFTSFEEALGRDEALRSAARPGHSEHQLGTTIDIEGGEAWLASNAWRYGFVMSYPPEHSPGTTCYKPEAWHFRYVGRESARAVRESGLSLRAWLWERQSDD